MTRNQAMRRDDMVGGRNDESARQGQSDEWSGRDYDLRPGYHHGAQDGGQDYDERAYAPDPDQPYGYDDAGNPIYYEPEPRKLKSNRSGLMMVGAVLAIAVVGGAGAVGYKMMRPGGMSGEPPLIKADTEPVKTVPKSAAPDAPAQNKAVYDRVDPAAPKSKVVSREEEPVDLPSAPSGEPRNADASRIILPGGPASAQPVAPDTSGSEPRKVKTVAIRPSEPPAAPGGAMAQTQSQTPASDPIAETARTGQAPRASDFDNGIMSGDNAPLRTDEPRLASTPKPVPTRAQPAPVPTAQTRTVTTTPVRQPQTQLPATQAPSRNDPAQVAAVQPRAPAPAAAPTAAPAGGFVVQVTSQRSEADARAAYANLQKRFPQVLGPYKASIQTATVADRGTYYRVRVGPFSNGSDASTVCSNLRAAGGDCVVAKN